MEDARIDSSHAFAACEPFLSKKSGIVHVRGGEFSAIDSFLDIIHSEAGKARAKVVTFDPQIEFTKTTKEVMLFLGAELGLEYQGSRLTIAKDVLAFSVRVQDVNWISSNPPDAYIMRSLIDALADHLKCSSTKLVLIFKRLDGYADEFIKWIWNDLWGNCLTISLKRNMLSMFIGSAPGKKLIKVRAPCEYVDLSDLYDGHNLEKAIDDLMRVYTSEFPDKNADEARSFAKNLLKDVERRPSLLYSRLAEALNDSCRL